MNFKDYQWEVINEEDGGNVFKFTVFVDFARLVPKQKFGCDFNIALEVEKGHIKYIPDVRFREFSRKLLDRQIDDPNYLNELVSTNQQLNKKIQEFAQEAAQKDPISLSNAEIQEIVSQWLEIYQEQTNWGISLVFQDMGAEYLTNDALEAIGECVQGTNLDATEVFSILSSPLYKSPIFKEEGDILKLAQEGTRDPAAIEQHAKKHAWTYYAYEGPAMTPEQVLESIDRAIQEGGIEEKLAKHESYLSDLEKKQKEIYDQVEFTSRAQKLIDIAREAMVVKDERKFAFVHAFYLLEPLFREIVKRGQIDWRLFHYLLPWEVEDFLEGKLSVEGLEKRYQHCAYFSDKTMITGDEVKEFSKMTELDAGDATEVKGQCGCSGVVQGTVKIVNNAGDMDKMEEGDVLVAVATTPEVVPAMKKAAAIVTDVGGITSHAAIVCREMTTPCVIGTKLATKVFQDGDQVEVDAASGTVKKI